jgi:hypothetical protein
MLVSGSAYAAGISVSTSRGFSTTLNMECPKVDFTNAVINGKKAVALTAEDASVSFVKDAPALPRYTAMVMVDPTARPVFTVKSLQSEVIELDKVVVPSRGNFTRNINPADVPYNFGEVYSKDAWYPAEKDLVKMGAPFIFREVRGVNVVVNPVQYNPVQNKLKIHKNIQISIRTGDKDTTNTIKKSAPISKTFENIYKNTFVNFKQASSRLPRLDENGRLLIIAYDKFMEAMKPFVDWKKKCGIEVKMVPLSAAGSTNTDIKAFIQDEYNQGGLTHIMLIGDAEQIPTNKGVKERADSDPCYTKLAGNDHVPDAIISRLSATNVAEVENQVAKFINYERFPTQDKAWYTTAFGVASNEGSPKDWEYMDENREALLSASFKTINKVYDPGASKAKVAELVNAGCSLINYLGHGAGTFWGTTRFSNSDIAKLHNGLKMPIIWDVACVNGRFVRYTGFGEAWLRAGTVEKPAGAVAYAGSTTNMQWVPPIKVQAEINKNYIANEVYKTVGGLFINGVIKGLEIYGTAPSGSGVMMYEQWHIFGDGTLMTRFKAPKTIESESKATRNGDNTKVTVYAIDEDANPVSNARVVVYSEGVKNVKTATTNSEGEAVITMPKGFEGYVTILHSDIVPVVDQKITF